MESLLQLCYMLSVVQGHGGMRDDSRQRRGQLTFTEVAEQVQQYHVLYRMNEPRLLISCLC